MTLTCFLPHLHPQLNLYHPRGGYSHTLPIRVCAPQRGRVQFCKQPTEIIQGQIAVKNMVQCVNKQTVVLFAP